MVDQADFCLQAVPVVHHVLRVREQLLHQRGHDNDVRSKARSPLPEREGRRHLHVDMAEHHGPPQPLDKHTWAGYEFASRLQGLPRFTDSTTR